MRVEDPRRARISPLRPARWARAEVLRPRAVVSLWRPAFAFRYELFELWVRALPEGRRAGLAVRCYFRFGAAFVAGFVAALIVLSARNICDVSGRVADSPSSAMTGMKPNRS